MPFETKAELLDMAEELPAADPRRRVPLHHRARRAAPRPVQPRRRDRVRVRARADPRRARAAARLGLGVARDAEADVRLAPDRPAVAAHRAARPGKARARERAAAEHALARRVLGRRPLPDVPGHVQQAVGARAVRMRADRRRGAVLDPGPTAARLSSSSSPHGYVRASVPRAAFSHSASVGSRPPAQAQNADASSQSTNVTGWSGGAGQCGGAAAPVSATKRSYCSFVTGVRASSNASTSTSRCRVSPGSRPIT